MRQIVRIFFATDSSLAGNLPPSNKIPASGVCDDRDSFNCISWNMYRLFGIEKHDGSYMIPPYLVEAANSALEVLAGKKVLVVLNNNNNDLYQMVANLTLLAMVTKGNVTMIPDRDLTSEANTVVVSSEWLRLNPDIVLFHWDIDAQTDDIPGSLRNYFPNAQLVQSCKDIYASLYFESQPNCHAIIPNPNPTGLLEALQRAAKGLTDQS